MKISQLERTEFPSCWVNCGYAMDAAIHTCQAVCPGKIDMYHREINGKEKKKGKLLAVHRMKWRKEKPDDFPCMVCRGEYGQGEFKVKVARGPVTVQAVVCRVCAKKPERVVEYFLGEKKQRKL